MGQSTACAVCGFENIGRDQQKCPQCDADLTCFLILDQIPDESLPAEVRIKRLSTLEIYLAVVTTVSVLLLGIIFFDFQQLQSKVGRLQTALLKNTPRPIEVQVANKDDKKNRRKQNIKAVREQKKKVPTPQTLHQTKRPKKTGVARKRFGWYRVRRKDTLWSIAKKVYQQGIFYPVLLELNPGLGVYNIVAGQKLKILVDTSRVKKMYNTIVKRERDVFIWYYQIQASDDLRVIAGKFYDDKGMIEQLFEDNPASRFSIGEKIKIIID